MIIPEELPAAVNPAAPHTEAERLLELLTDGTVEMLFTSAVELFRCRPCLISDSTENLVA
jgi:hypothetical protein